MTGAVARSYLGEAIMDREGIAVRARGYVAVGKRVGQCARGSGELLEQRSAQTAFLGLDDGAGVMRDETAQHRVGVLDIAEVAGSVERVEAGVDQVGGVADIMEPRGGFEQVRILS